MNQLQVKLLAWDSNFLGFPVGQLRVPHLSAADLTTVVAQSRAVGIRLIYIAVDPADSIMAAAAHQVGAQLVDRKMTFAREINLPLPTGQRTASGDGIIFSTATFTSELEELAWQSGAFSRFRRDSRFASGVFKELYTQWLRASLSGELARVVLFYPSPKGEEVGLLTLGEQQGIASIGLLAVAGANRGQGIGQQLVEAARQQAQHWGCSTLQVVTQRDNKQACRFYIRYGFDLRREEHIYHLWL